MRPRPGWAISALVKKLRVVSYSSSGAGVIIGADGTPLLTEFLDVVPDGAQEALFQTHHLVISSEDQVQIYEELVQNAKRAFTTSFVNRVYHPKDNRLLSDGALTPVTVIATLYSQSIPPYFLKQRFETAPQGSATRRLYYLASRLQTEGTLIENWKLKTASAKAQLQP